ncbi:MAG: hypothetical protein IJO43_02665 [Bacilli bacterium]|nr:hypothetical protein [Bacilli bacterium]
MKKVCRVLLAILLAFSLTGCVKYNVSMEVKDDKSVTLEILYGMEVDSSIVGDESWNEDEDYWDEDYWSEGESDWKLDEDDVEFGEGVEGTITDEDGNVIYDSSEDESWDDDEYYDEDEDYWDEEDDYYDEETNSGVSVDDYEFLESKGFKVEEFTEEKDDATISGVKITKTYKNIDDITKDKKIIVDFNEKFGEEENFDDSQIFYKKGNNYVANFVFDFSEEGDDTDYSAYQDMFDLQYKIKLPHKSVSNNATSVSKDGKELTWDLKYGEKNEVNFEFSMSGSNTTLIIILIACGVIVGGGTVALLINNSKKKKNNNVMPSMPMNNMQ